MEGANIEKGKESFEKKAEKAWNFFNDLMYKTWKSKLEEYNQENPDDEFKILEKDEWGKYEDSGRGLVIKNDEIIHLKLRVLDLILERNDNGDWKISDYRLDAMAPHKVKDEIKSEFLKTKEDIEERVNKILQ